MELKVGEDFLKAKNLTSSIFFVVEVKQTGIVQAITADFTFVGLDHLLDALDSFQVHYFRILFSVYSHSAISQR
jgi:hypothetical protein